MSEPIEYSKVMSTVDFNRGATQPIWDELDRMRKALEKIVRRAEFDEEETDNDRQRHLRHILATAQEALK